MTRVAAVDVGTNTVRLLVADVISGELVDVVRERAVTRLGEGVDAARRLDPAAIDRTADVVERFIRQAHRHRAERVRVAATSAVRDSANRDDFARRVTDATGCRLEVLSGSDEGRIARLGAVHGLGSGPWIVCDIGGGSTELISEHATVSMDIGSVRLKERCLHSDPPSPHEVDNARAVAHGALDATDGRLALTGRERIVGVAATVTSLAALVLGLDRYDSTRIHHATIARTDVDLWMERLLAMSASQIAQLGPVDRGRADVLPSGVLILSCVMERLDFEEVLVSEHDILDGLVRDAVA